MTEEQRKWYLAGANDMEAGRLVTKTALNAEEANAVWTCAWREDDAHWNPAFDRAAYDSGMAKLSLIANGENG